MSLSYRSFRLCVVAWVCVAVSAVWSPQVGAELSPAERSFLTATACAADAPVVAASALPMIFVPGSLMAEVPEPQASSLSAAGTALTVGPAGDLAFALAPTEDLPAAGARIVFATAFPPHFQAVEPAGVTLHRMRGNDTSGWRTHENNTYYAIEAPEVWPGVALRVRGNGRRLDLRFEVAPGAEPHEIRWTLPDRAPGDVTARGEHLAVRLDTAHDRRVVWRQPRAWQEAAGGLEPVGASYRSAGVELGFELERFDATAALYVEVSLDLAPYLGVDAAPAADGSLYLTGQVPVIFPTEASDAGAGRIDRDVLVTHIAADGSLTSMTVLGGEGDDSGRALVTSGTGRALVAGITSSGDFPSAPRTARESGASDGFVLELSPESGELLAVTRYGGPAADTVDDLVQTADGLHVVGRAGTGFPSLHPERLSFSTWWPDLPGEEPLARRLSHGGDTRTEIGYYLARLAPEGLEVDAISTFPVSTPLQRVEAWASCGRQEVQVGLRPRPGLRNTGGAALPVCEAVTGAPRGPGSQRTPSSTAESELRNALATACGGSGGTSRVLDTYEIDVTQSFFGCPFISDGWGYHALCWKSLHWNVFYDAPTSGVPSGTVQSTDTGTLNSFEGDAGVFPNGNPPGSWFGRNSLSAGELATGAAIAMDRWSNPSYANVDHGRQIALKRVMFEVDDFHQTLANLCSDTGWSDLGMREDEAARDCIAKNGGLFLLQEVTFDRWDGLFFDDTVTRSAFDFGQDYSEDGTWITDPPSPEEGAVVEELARRLGRRVLVRAPAERIVRTRIHGGRVVARETAPDGLGALVRLDDLRRVRTPRRRSREAAISARSGGRSSSRPYGAPAAEDLRPCATPDPTPEVLASVEQRLRERTPTPRLAGRTPLGDGRALRSTGSLALPPEEEPDETPGSQEIVIPVVWHVIYDPSTGAGDLTWSDVDFMIRFINDTAFSLSDIRLDFWNIEWHANPEWFLMEPGSQQERDAKQNNWDPFRYLNIYSTVLKDIGGFASPPWELTSKPELDGVVVDFDFLLGTDPPFDQGDTVTHEIGHWLGLFHTYFPNTRNRTGTCAYNCTTGCGDYVADTPPEAQPTFFFCPRDASGQREPNCDCPFQEDTCPSDFFPDAIENYMNNTDDFCRALFTSGQDDRMRTMIAVYRSLLL